MRSKKLFSPGLFDTAQDISFSLPVDLLKNWSESDQSARTASELLAPTLVRGTTVVSDTAGLTKLTAERGLIDILALIDLPKQIVYNFGRSIGGEGVGVWAADNTQMWYPESVGAQKIARMLLAVQERINEKCGVRIGMGAHAGMFYNLGGGLFGDHADLIEHVTENASAGGEILVTEAFAENLGDGHSFSLSHRADVEHHGERFFRLTDGPLHDLPISDVGKYPIPYSSDFHDDLIAYSASASGDKADRIEDRHAREMFVVLIERARADEGATAVRLLDDLALSLVMADTARHHIGSKKNEIKVAGNLGIYVFPEGAMALDFAGQVMRELRSKGVESKAGITRGSVLVFDLPGGARDIAGAPVNIASKMAQDKGVFGHIYATADLFENSEAHGGVPAMFSISNSTIEAVDLVI